MLEIVRNWAKSFGPTSFSLQVSMNALCRLISESEEPAEDAPSAELAKQMVELTGLHTTEKYGRGSLDSSR